MTKRSPGSFSRRDMDFYPTPLAAAAPLVPHLIRAEVKTFAEPCCGDGALIRHLHFFGFDCVAQGDLRDGVDARTWNPEDLKGADAGITNPPWEARTMMDIMDTFSLIVPTWFLIYSDWLFTKGLERRKLMGQRCTDIVPIGRVKWFPESKSVGYDNCCWVRMDIDKREPVKFWPFPYNEK